MKFLPSDYIDLDKNGFILKKNILSHNEVEKVKSIILRNNSGKGGPDTYYASDIKKIFLKMLKLDFKKSAASIFFINLKKKLELDRVASNFFKEKSQLSMIDGYHNKKTKEEILPWHTDQAYGGSTTVKKIVSPNYFYIKFFFYLTNVSANNGCTSYIPGSHKVTYALRSCLYEKKINYEPFLNAPDLVNIIEKKGNFNIIKDKLNNKIILEEFLANLKKCISDKHYSEFDFQAAPGDLLIFNDGGVHRGSNPSINDRVVLRYLYSKKSLN